MTAHCEKPNTVYEADEDAVYDDVVEIDLSKVRPTVAFPHLPGNAKTIDEIEAEEQVKIDQVVIRFLYERTNGRYEESCGNTERSYGTSGCACDGCSGYTEDL